MILHEDGLRLNEVIGLRYLRLLQGEKSLYGVLLSML